MIASIRALVSLFNSREEAVVIWLAIGLVMVLLRGDTRRSLLHLVKSFFQWKILLIMLAMLLYVGAEVFGLYKVGFWDASLLKDSLLWTFGVAFVLLINWDTSAQGKHHFRKAVSDNLKMVAILEFIANLYTFKLWIEIVLVPMLFLIVGANAVAASDVKYVFVKKATDFLMSVFGMYLFGFAVASIIRNFYGFATSDNLRSFLLPMLLAIGYLPFLYAIALYELYESLFLVRLPICLRDNPSLLKYTKWKILRLCSLDRKRLKGFMRDEDVSIDLMNLKSADDVVRMIRDAKQRGL